MREPLITQITRHFLPCEATVLGVRLNRFTLWHWAQLAAHESPYANLNYGETLGQLATAVLVCSTPVFSPVPFRRSWVSSLLWKYRAIRYGGIRALHEEQVFFDWLIYNLTGPERWNRKGSGSVQCPPWLFLVSLLISKGMSEQDAWAMPVGRARCYLAALSVSEGGPDFFTDEELHELIKDGGYTLEQLGLA
jgi:hypothetical protein